VCVKFSKIRQGSGEAIRSERPSLARPKRSDDLGPLGVKSSARLAKINIRQNLWLNAASNQLCEFLPAAVYSEKPTTSPPLMVYIRWMGTRRVMDTLRDKQAPEAMVEWAACGGA